MSTKRTDWTGLKKGQKFEIIGNINGHNYPKNRILTLNRDVLPGEGEGNNSLDNCAEELPHGNALKFKDINLLPQTVEFLEQNIVNIKLQAKKDLEKITATADTQVADLTRKLEICKALGLKEYDDDIIKIHEILAIAQEKGMTNNLKISAISKLL